MKIKLSRGAERDIERACDFYRKIDLDLAVNFNDCIAADIDSLQLDAGFMPALMVGTTLSQAVFHL